jgi:hypothetical protein
MTTTGQKVQEAREARARARHSSVTAAREQRHSAAVKAIAALSPENWLDDEEHAELVEWLLIDHGRGPLSAGVHASRVGALLAEVQHYRAAKAAWNEVQTMLDRLSMAVATKHRICANPHGPEGAEQAEAEIRVALQAIRALYEET